MPHGNECTDAMMEESILILRDAGVDINHQRSKDGATPLMAAVARCDTVAIRVLLRLGARVDVTLRGGGSILHLVAWSRDAEVIDLLKTANLTALDPEERGQDGNRPRDIRPESGIGWRKPYTEEAWISFLDDLTRAGSNRLVTENSSEEAESDSEEEFFDAEG